MKVLVITPTPTHPTTQGNRVRVLQMASAMKRTGASVELLYYALDGVDHDAIEAMRAAWNVVYLVPTGGFRPRRQHPAYWGVDDWVSPNLINAVRSLEKTTQYDVVLVNYVWCSLLLDIFAGSSTLRVLDTHDAFGGRHEVARAAGMQPHWFYTSVQEEAKGLNRANIVIAIQKDEADYYKSITSARVETIEYAASPNFFPSFSSRDPTIGYLGSGNPWNVKSIIEFDTMLANVLTKQHYERWPRLFLFGGITKTVGPLQVFQSLGVVDDVRDVYKLLDLVVNPMVGGTGLKIKTVEALAFGKPVLTTRSGGAGLESIHPDLLLDDLSRLIDRVLELIANPKSLTSLGLEMRQGYLSFHGQVEQRMSALALEMLRVGVAG